MKYALKYEIVEPQWLQNRKKPLISLEKSGGLKVIVRNAVRQIIKFSSKALISLGWGLLYVFAQIYAMVSLFALIVIDTSKIILMSLWSGLIKRGLVSILTLLGGWLYLDRDQRSTGMIKLPSLKTLKKGFRQVNLPSNRLGLSRPITLFDIIIAIILVAIYRILVK